MLLAWFSHWRGAGAVRHPTGIWPYSYMGHTGPIFELGPAFGPEFPLLSDTQIARLLCEGCPFVRPSLVLIPPYLDDLELDTHDSAARMRAILCASNFHEWREGTPGAGRSPDCSAPRRATAAGSLTAAPPWHGSLASRVRTSTRSGRGQGSGRPRPTRYDYFPPGGLQLPAVLEVDPTPGPPAVAACPGPAGAPAPRRSSRHRA
jgi:hypothetical protein